MVTARCVISARDNLRRVLVHDRTTSFAKSAVTVASDALTDTLCGNSTVPTYPGSSPGTDVGATMATRCSVAAAVSSCGRRTAWSSREQEPVESRGEELVAHEGNGFARCVTVAAAPESPARIRHSIYLDLASV